MEKALADGSLKRPWICSKCGKSVSQKGQLLQAHHRDYEKPLDIEWLCKKCHMKLHHSKSQNVKKDNSTFGLKRLLRKNLLKEIENPVIMEMYGGAGKLFKSCYAGIATGVVFEKDKAKTDILGRQRPEWFVYQCNCLDALDAGCGKDLGINFVDFDPYGNPWLAIDLFFRCGHYNSASKLCVVATDGLRQKLKMNGGWTVGSMKEVVKIHGNDYLYANYLIVCQELMEKKALEAGYYLKRWAGYYCGHANQMTHYAAVLER